MQSTKLVLTTIKHLAKGYFIWGTNLAIPQSPEHPIKKPFDVLTLRVLSYKVYEVWEGTISVRQWELSGPRVGSNWRQKQMGNIINRHQLWATLLGGKEGRQGGGVTTASVEGYGGRGAGEPLSGHGLRVAQLHLTLGVLSYEKKNC